MPGSGCGTNSLERWHDGFWVSRVSVTRAETRECIRFSILGPMTEGEGVIKVAQENGPAEFNLHVERRYSRFLWSVQMRNSSWVPSSHCRRQDTIMTEVRKRD